MALNFDQLLLDEKVPPALQPYVRSLYHQESGSGRNTQTSNAGAVGGMQILPSTFRQVADPGWDIHNPEHNARAGIRYYLNMVDYGKGDPRLGAVGYYGGPGAIHAAQRGQARVDPRNPKAPNTFQYADQVITRANEARFQNPGQGLTLMADAGAGLADNAMPLLPGPLAFVIPEPRSATAPGSSQASQPGAVLPESANSAWAQFTRALDERTVTGESGDPDVQGYGTGSGLSALANYGRASQGKSGLGRGLGRGLGQGLRPKFRPFDAFDRVLGKSRSSRSSRRRTAQDDDRDEFDYA